MPNDSVEPTGFSLYDRATGMIYGQVGTVVTAVDLRAPGDGILSGRWDDRQWYVVAGSPNARPKLFPFELIQLPADGATPLKVTGIPAGALVRLGAGDWLEITDGEFEFITAFPGEWRLEVLMAFPFQDQVVRVVANAH